MKKNLKIWRDKNGIPHVEAENEIDVYWGQGYVHAKDRGMQMLLMRILGQGRVSELLDSSEDSLKIDIFFRKMNWTSNTTQEIEKLDDRIRGYVNAYCDGANAAFAERVPWEFKLLGYKPEKWKPEDSVLISRMIGYLSLAQSQAEMEKLFVEIVQAGISEEKLHELFPGILGGLNMELLKKVTIPERIVPPNVLWGIGAPRMMASNNWVVSGEKTRSGKPIAANDPHLEVNRLPNVWSEIVLKSGERYIMGGSMPGFPGVLVGRNPELTWGVTYTFADAVDSWVEKCNDGKYFREEKNQWLDFQQRKEIIKRKKKEPYEIIFFENEQGTLDGDPLQEGFYLTTKWAAADSGALAISAVLDMWNAKTVDDGMATLGKLESSWNFLFADANGEIGYQMTGRIPKRRKGVSGFVPLPAWKKKNEWQGFYRPEELPRAKNPKEGYLVTANNNLNDYGKAKPINMPMGAYRADRIKNLLAQGDQFTVEDMCHMHYDVYSLQAEYFMKILKPLLPDTPQGKILKEWDLQYSADSEGAYLFEKFYAELYREVFGKGGIGEQVVDYLKGETGIFIDFYENFDRVLLSKNSTWFGGRSREEIFRAAAERALKTKPKKWKSVQEFTLTNILFGGKLPRFLGFDRGPVVSIGGRATIHQGQIYRSAGRDTSFLPSFRLVTDFSAHEIFTNLIGGPSDRRFSKWYCSDLKNWISGKYKRLTPESKLQGADFILRDENS